MATIHDRPVEQREKEWKSRIRSLFDRIHSWLLNTGYKFKKGTPVSISGVKEYNFGLKTELKLPTADIYKADRLVASLKPKGLWTIGANGRVDLLNPKYTIILVDKSEDQEESNWEIIVNNKEKRRMPLARENFLELLFEL